MSDRIPEEVFQAAERAFRFAACSMLNSLVAQTMQKETLSLADLATRIGRDESWFLERLANPDDLTLDNVSDIALSCWAMPVFSSFAKFDWEPIPQAKERLGAA